MAFHEIEFAVISRALDDYVWLAEALFYSEVSRYGDDPERLKRAIAKNVTRIIETENLSRVWARTPPQQLETYEFNLRLSPPVKRSTWREPIDLRLDVVRWSHSDSTHIAFIPALGIEIVSNRLNDLVVTPKSAIETREASLIERHAQAELLRRRVTADFRALLLLARERGVSLTRVRSMVNIRTPKQVAANAGQSEKKESILAATAIDLTNQKLAPAYEVETTVAQVVEALTGKSARSVLLVGKAGVGKTALVQELARRRAEFGLGSIPFWATSGARLVAGMSGYGMWQERCDALWREAEKTNAIVHFGNLIELMDTGKSEHNSQGLASFFRQRFQRSQALAILECTPEQLPLIEREDPATLRVFQVIALAEPSPQSSKRILKQYADAFPRLGADSARKNSRRALSPLHRDEPQITEEGLAVLDRLHRRYAGYSAFPGRPLRFLRGLLQDSALSDQIQPLGPTEVTRAFARETGLPRFLLDDQEPFAANHTRKWFEDRVIDQSAAVDLIVNLLAIVKARLTRPRRPIASLLFAGPTGVGKTELAKSLAQFFFSDEGRIARFDMGEYSDALAVTRLVGGATGNEGTLTARIREQPFSVLLFDEFEKAHQSFFDLLLQMLGEGRLTDSRGRLADFTNSVVVLTSNLGAEHFSRARPGFKDERDADGQLPGRSHSAAQKHFSRAVQDFLRPEIFNRIDHVVPFSPLTALTVERIAERELSLIQKRDGLRLCGVTLQVSREVIAGLAQRGYDPRYGARPLKRIIERELLLPLAVELNNRASSKKGNGKKLLANVGIEGGRLSVELREQGVDAQAVNANQSATSTTMFHNKVSLAAKVAGIEELRRGVARLERSSAVTDLQNTIWKLTEIERRISKAARRGKINKKLANTRYALQRPWEATALKRLPEYIEVAGRLKNLAEKIATAEDKSLLLLYGSETSGAPLETTSAVQQLQTELRLLLGQLLDLRHSQPNRITLALYSENNQSLFQLARGYHAAATASGLTVQLAQYTSSLPQGPGEEKGGFDGQRAKRSSAKPSITLSQQSEELKTIEMFGRTVVRIAVKSSADFLASAPDTTTAIIFGLTGLSAYTSYDSERGLHTFSEGKASHHLFVHTSDADFTDYQPPASLERRGAISPGSHHERRREYARTDGYIADQLLDERRAWHSAQTEGTTSLASLLAYFIDKQRERAADRLIDE